MLEASLFKASTIELKQLSVKQKGGLISLSLQYVFH